MPYSKKSGFQLITTLLLVVSFFSLVAMRDNLSRFTFITLMFVLVDIYALVGLLSLFEDRRSKWIFFVVYICASLYGYYGMNRSFERWRTDAAIASPLANFTSGFAFTLLISKFVLVFLFAVQDIGRLIFGLGQGAVSLFSEHTYDQIMPSRRNFLTAAATAIAAVPFTGMLYGITRGKYRYTVENVVLKFKDLPEKFHGFTLAQISDIHSGSWDNFNEVARGVAKIGELNADMIVFTGDLVNENKDEINPYMDLLADLNAPFGKYAILGNHDYYGVPRGSNEEKRVYWNDFYSKFRNMGFDLLLNENRTIEKENETFKLIGVENWGKGRWFSKKGDMDQACEGCSDEEFAILLSHDPTHFDEKVVDHRKKVHLTLSGHTHGMQFGINLPNFKWSPIKYRYKKWMGLYEEKGQKLYVNRGFGFLAFPGRVGMWPEITLIELQKDV